MNRPDVPRNDPTELTVQDLYPELDEEELKEAEQNLHAFFGAVQRIHERLKRKESERFDIVSRSS